MVNITKYLLMQDPVCASKPFAHVATCRYWLVILYVVKILFDAHPQSHFYQ